MSTMQAKFNAHSKFNIVDESVPQDIDNFFFQRPILDSQSF